MPLSNSVIALVVIACFLFTACPPEAEDEGDTFTPSTNNATTNDVATLGLVGIGATSSDTAIATVAITDNKIVITSVAAGTATITVSATDYDPATISVTVAADGSITLGTISKGQESRQAESSYSLTANNAGSTVDGVANYGAHRNSPTLTGISAARGKITGTVYITLTGCEFIFYPTLWTVLS
ncbi:MAG: hypothetical protein LBO67_09945 [Spirochaetaceae bacterium]|jgi:hypothetical protein|nr:hypothetical protein [Spirochaetaceae bacterium]